MESIVLNYDPERLWEDFMYKNHIRHDKITNDPKKFILYYYDEFHLLKIGFEFGIFYHLKMSEYESPV